MEWKTVVPVHTGAQTLYRFSLRLEGGRTYYGAGLYPTHQEADRAAIEAARTRKVIEP